MNNSIKIGNQEISVKEFNGKRVVTFMDVDMVHERGSMTIKSTLLRVKISSSEKRTKQKKSLTSWHLMV